MTELLNKRSRPALVALLLFLSACASPPPHTYGPDDEEETLAALQPKIEQDAPLPAFPHRPNWITVDTGPTSRQSYGIDGQTLTVTSDHIVRYVVVSTSSSGAKNISFEGINCQTLHFKRYAYGTPQGKWVRTRENRWEKVSSMSQNQLHYTLTQFFFCKEGSVAGTTKEMLERIRANRPLNY